jgi:hypothetical protein
MAEEAIPMTDKPLRTLEGHSAKEPTAVTLRSIREILAESGADADALLMQKSEAPAKSAQPAPQPAHDALPPLATPDESAAPGEVPKAGLSALLKAKLFGSAKR